VTNLKIALIAAITFVLLEGAIFRSGFYARYLEPSSSTGLFERNFQDEQKRKPFGPDEVLVVGDSRIGEGFSAKLANAARAEHGYYFANVSVAGTTPRCWYYLLRDLDPTRMRYRAIILPVEAYEDIDIFEDLGDRLLDLHFCIMRLRYSDSYEFASSLHTSRKRLEAFRGILFKGLVFQSDLLAFIEHPRRRLSDAATSREHSWKWRYDYVGHTEDLSGLQVDWTGNTIRFPEMLSSPERERIQQNLLGPIPKQDGTLARYRLQWYGRILDLYRNSDTRLIFLALPRGPMVPPDPRIQPLSHSIRDLARRPGVILLPEDSFALLEKGDFYFDSLHLNARGRAQFSAMLARLIKHTLGPSRN
jgi:hypothetical protein